MNNSIFKNRIKKMSKLQLETMLCELTVDKDRILKEKFYKNLPMLTPWHDQLINKIKKQLSKKYVSYNYKDK